MGYEKEFDKQKKALEDQQKYATSKLKELGAHCTHQKKNGRLNLTLINGTGGNIFKCNRCGAEFSIKIHTKDEVIAAVDTMNDVLNQMKALSIEEEDLKYAKKLGTMVADLEQVPRLYSLLVLERGQAKRNNNDRPMHKGKFGVQNVNSYS